MASRGQLTGLELFRRQLDAARRAAELDGGFRRPDITGWRRPRPWNEAIGGTGRAQRSRRATSRRGVRWCQRTFARSIRASSPHDTEVEATEITWLRQHHHGAAGDDLCCRDALDCKRRSTGADRDAAGHQPGSRTADASTQISFDRELYAAIDELDRLGAATLDPHSGQLGVVVSSTRPSTATSFGSWRARTDIEWIDHRRSVGRRLRSRRVREPSQHTHEDRR